MSKQEQNKNMTEQNPLRKFDFRSVVLCPYCRKEIMLLQNRAKALTLEEFNSALREMVQADLAAMKQDRKAARLAARKR